MQVFIGMNCFLCDSESAMQPFFLSHVDDVSSVKIMVGGKCTCTYIRLKKDMKGNKGRYQSITQVVTVLAQPTPE